MTHEGRMARGKFNVDNNINLENADTKYYLKNKGKEFKSVKLQTRGPKTKKKMEEEKEEISEDQEE